MTKNIAKKLQTLLLGTILLGVVFTTFDIQQASAEVDLFSGPGEIHGLKWNDENGNGVIDGTESGVSGVEICLSNELIFDDVEFLGATGFDDFILPEAFANLDDIFPELACDFTDIDGNYSFVGLEIKEYFVFESLPSGTTNTTPITQNVILTDTAQIALDVNFGNRVANAPPAEVGIDPVSSYEHEGLPVVYWQNELTITKDVGPTGFDHCGADSPVAVKLVVGPFAETPAEPPVEVLMTNTVGETWEATVGPLSPAHGTAPLTFYVDCPADTVGFPEDITLISGEDEIQDGGNIYIDPSGTVTDVCTGDPLEDATVTLFIEDILFPGTFFIAPATTPPIIPAVNPQTTLADGQYGWVVIPGNYQVLVEKAGYISQTSVTLTIPPAVTDLDFALERVDGCPVEPDTLLVQKESTLEQIDMLVDGASDKVLNEAEKAKKAILKSTNTALWNDDGNSVDSKKGKKVFHEEEKAVKSLLKIQKQSGLDVSGIIDVLIGVDQTLVMDAIAEAETFEGNKVDKELAKSAKEMSKALEDLNDEKFDKAIHHYEKAWKHAQNAIKHGNK